jgi:hypothetical protein
MQLIEESKILVADFILIELPIVTTTFSIYRLWISLHFYLEQDELAFKKLKLAFDIFSMLQRFPSLEQQIHRYLIYSPSNADKFIQNKQMPSFSHNLYKGLLNNPNIKAVYKTGYAILVN